MKKNTFERGVPQDEAFGLEEVGGGVGVSHKGIPRDSEEYLTAQTEFSGIPMPGPGMAPDRELSTAPKCIATTKAGNLCKAYSTTDTAFCVGHNK